jgi:hypothetical protein
VLQFTGVTLGSDASSASLLLNTNQVGAGSIGVVLSLPADTTFSPGTQQVALVTANIALLTNATAQTAPVRFTDSPTVRQLSDPQANVLDATYANGIVTISPGAFAGDVSPRPNGDNALTVVDWVQEGRYVARLDFPTNSAELQRADCAPRSSSGDGLITASDWVQVGRYVAGLDPLTLAAPPQAPKPAVALDSLDANARRLRFGDPRSAAQGGVIVPVILDAQGGENALSFSIDFVPAAVAYVGTSLGADMASAALDANPTDASSGEIGFALALTPGQTLAPGTREILEITFGALPATPPSSPLAFTDQPVPREIADANASALAVEYVAGSVAFPSQSPELHFGRSSGIIQLWWSSSATNFVLQQTTGALVPATSWTKAPVTPFTIGDQNLVSLPIGATNQFFRLFRP